MAPDIGRLGVDVAATQSALSEAIATVRARREQIVADTPRRTAASYGQGLGDRAARLVDLRRQAHEVRLAHIDRLQRGLGVAAGTVAAVSATEQESRRAFRAGEGA
ncbi:MULTISPECIES: hypothetical protein [unclassified Corynebacterium]|uniref:hypothetical protein n=1 Tax=unclassified Corynebacterium TaxID=2624378 RepID=UPI0030AB0B5C